MIKKINWWKVAIAAFYTVFFGVLLITGEPMYLGDSFQHENQFVTREPVYALLIQLLKCIFMDFWQQAIIFIQALVAIFCYTAFTLFLYKEYKLPNWTIVFVLGILLSPHILTPLAAESNMIITNSIMTEGISYSFFLLFLIPTIKACNEGKVWSKNVLLSLIAGIFVSLVRGQLMTLLVVWLIMMLVISLKQKAYKKIILYFVIFAVSFAGRTLIIKTYNYCEQGLFVNTVSSKAMSVANVIYVSDREDGEAIKNEELREIFYQIYDLAYADGLNYKFSQKGLINRAKHHEACHDTLNFDYFNVNVRDYIEEQTGITSAQYQELMIEIDKVAATMQGDLLSKVISRYAYNYIAMTTMGFVRTIAFVHPILNWYALIMYVVALLLVIVLYKKDKQSKGVKMMLLSLLMIAGNVFATSLVLQCVSRYMIYHLPIFYLSFGIMILELIKKEDRKNGI